MTKSKRRQLDCELLESRALLSGAHAAVEAREHARAEALEARREARAAADMATISPVTGGGLFSVGPAPSNADVQALQQAAVTNNTMMFLTQFDLFGGSNPAVRSASGSVLNDARNLDLAMWNLADSLGVTIPSDIEGSDVSIAQGVVMSVKVGSFDRSYQTAVSQVGTTMVGQLQSIETGATDAALRTFAATALPVVQSDLAALQAAASGGTVSLPPVSSSPSSSTLGGADLPTLELSYSTNLTERFQAQFTDLVTGNVRVQRYNEKLINDHEMMAVEEGMYAAATGTYLPASIQGQDLSTLMLIGAAGSPNYNRTYLKMMVTMHTMALTDDQQTAANATNPVIKAFATASIPTDFMHRQAAAWLLKEFIR